MQTDKFNKYQILINATDFEKSYNEEEYESHVIQALERGGNIQRYVPADFTLDFNKFDEKDNAKMAIRKRIRANLEKSQVPYTSVLNGIFMERLFDPFYKWKILNISSKEVEFYSQDPNDNPVLDFSLYPTVGRLTALATTNFLEETKNQTLTVVEESFSIHDLAQMLTNELGHGEWRVKHLGTIKDLEAKIIDRVKSKTEPDDQFGWDYLHAIFCGKGMIDGSSELTNKILGKQETVLLHQVVKEKTEQKLANE